MTALLIAAGMAGVAAAAEPCVKDIPAEVFRFFGDSDVSNVSCDDYVYQTVDLNADPILELVVYKKQFSCSTKGYCDQEIFQKYGGKYRNLGTLPGRFEIMKTATEGYFDLTVWVMNSQPIVYRWNGTLYKPLVDPTAKPKPTPTPRADDPWSSLP